MMKRAINTSVEGPGQVFRTDGRTYDICDSAAANIDDKDNTSSTSKTDAEGLIERSNR